MSTLVPGEPASEGSFIPVQQYKSLEKPFFFFGFFFFGKGKMFTKHITAWIQWYKVYNPKYPEKKSWWYSRETSEKAFVKLIENILDLRQFKSDLLF